MNNISFSDNDSREGLKQADDNYAPITWRFTSFALNLNISIYI